jgi:antitoxin ParD1/3/4
MRTNIVIDEDLMDAARKAGAFKTKKDAVEAGLRLVARQAAYREILKYRGKLYWDDSDAVSYKRKEPAATPYRSVSESNVASKGAASRARRVKA